MFSGSQTDHRHAYGARKFGGFWFLQTNELIEWATIAPLPLIIKCNKIIPIDFQNIPQCTRKTSRHYCRPSKDAHNQSPNTQMLIVCNLLWTVECKYNLFNSLNLGAENMHSKRYVVGCLLWPEQTWYNGNRFMVDVLFQVWWIWANVYFEIYRDIFILYCVQSCAWHFSCYFLYSSSQRFDLLVMRGNKIGWYEWIVNKLREKNEISWTR